jgi:hypothetical protein
MQVIILLGKEWWLLPTETKFTQKELAPYLSCKYIGVMQMGVSYHFFDMQPKAKALPALRAICEAAQHGMKPTYSTGGNIAFKRVRQSKVAVPA